MLFNSSSHHISLILQHTLLSLLLSLSLWRLFSLFIKWRYYIIIRFLQKILHLKDIDICHNIDMDYLDFPIWEYSPCLQEGECSWLYLCPIILSFTLAILLSASSHYFFNFNFSVSLYNYEVTKCPLQRKV